MKFIEKASSFLNKANRVGLKIFDKLLIPISAMVLLSIIIFLSCYFGCHLVASNSNICTCGATYLYPILKAYAGLMIFRIIVKVTDDRENR